MMAGGLLDKLSELANQVHQKDPDMVAPLTSVRVLSIAAKCHLSAYDSEYVTLAQDFGIKMVTADKKIMQAFPNTAVSLIDFVGQSSHE